MTRAASPSPNDSQRPFAGVDEGCQRFIAKLGAASDLSEDDKAALRPLCADERLIRAKRHVIREGENPKHIHIVLDGWAARYKIQNEGSRQIVAILLPGDICDLHSTILSRMDHGIVTLTDARIAYVPAMVMETLPIGRPNLLRALWRATLIDEAILRAWIANIGRRPALARIAHLFAELHARLKLIGMVSDGDFELPMTQEVLADAVGLTPVHVNRSMKKLREQGLVELRDNWLRITDVEALKRFCGFDSGYLHPAQLVRSHWTGD